MQQPITLYLDGYFVNQWDGTCFVALTEKGVTFATARALLRDGQGVPPALRELTGVARIPALQHGDVWLTESSAIVEYLEEVFSPPAYPPLFPADVRRRVRARQVMAWIRFELEPLRNERNWWMVVYPGVPDRPLTPGTASLARQLVELANKAITSGDFDDWSIAHVDLAFTLLRLAHTDVELTPAVRAFLDTAITRPSLRAYLDHPRPPNPPPASAARG
jgi:glutathione S-transferase